MRGSVKPVHLFLLFVFVTLVVVLGFNQLLTDSNPTMSASKLMHVDFEVFGRVQGVFFRKYTQSKAKSLDVRGWIRNTQKLTVQGEIEGDISNVENMKTWLRTEGSPSSRIDGAVFKNEKEIQEYSYKGFSIKH